LFGDLLVEHVAVEQRVAGAYGGVTPEALDRPLLSVCAA
jgi:hypothetical protein